MNSGYGGGVMKVVGLTVQAPCCIVAHDAREQTAWSDLHILG
jgi:hypothetical protein